MEIPSPNSCAPKFTLVHILAFLKFLQFLNIFPIVSTTRFSVINFPKPRNQFQNSNFNSFSLHRPIGHLAHSRQAGPTGQLAHRACAALSPFFFPAPTECAAVPCHPPPTFRAMEQTH
jgi:hypothetical protein